MGFTVRAHPEFSWSHKRDQVLRECERAYWFRYYGGHNGWLPDAPKERRDAWVAGKVTAVPAVLGTAIHARASECVRAAVRGEPLPTMATMLDRTRGALNHAVRSSQNPEAFYRDPKRHVMLREMLDGEPLTTELVEAMRERMHTAVSALRTHSLLDELRAVPAERVLLIDSLTAFEHEGVRVFAVPDLAYYDRAHWTVVDWKSGSTDSAVDAVTLYSLLLRDGLRLVGAEESVRCRVIGLGDDSEVDTRITPADLADAESRIAASVARMQALTADSVANAPLPRDDFRATLNWKVCQRCAYLRLCKTAELRDTESDRVACSDPTSDVSVAA